MPATAELTPTIHALLARLAPPVGVPERAWRAALAGPAREFLTRPGQRFRARLVEAAWGLAGRADPVPELLPWVVELLHAGSLIVDDIEDESVQRRGRGALHRMLGVPTALNTGNWLYFWPLCFFAELGVPAEVELRLHRATVAALRRCHEGQALDLGVTVGDLHPKEFAAVARTVSESKTGGLTGLAAQLGAVAAGADDALSEALLTFGVQLGVGLQMQNDLAELSGASGPLKQPEDLLHGRVTWPWAWAAESLPPHEFDRLQMRAVRLAAGHGDAGALARDLAAAVGPDPRARVADHLRSCTAGLARVAPQNAAMRLIHSEVERLIHHYG